MRIVSISDLHAKHRHIEVPKGDTIICAGDISNKGEFEIIKDFIFWFKDLPHKNKILIFGNHELGMDKPSKKKKEILKYIEEFGIHYLEDSSIIIDNIYFYGSPYTPFFHNWAWNLPRDGKELAQKWGAIPNQTNVLITHGPPYQILDLAPRGFFDHEHTGCKLLSERIWELPNLKAHVFGHIHYSRGIQKEYGITFANSCICNEQYNPINHPHVFDI